MTSLSGQFLQVEKKIRQMAVAKMQQKMDHAAEITMKAADKSRNYDDVTGNLYKSTAIGTYYNGSLQSIHYAPSSVCSVIRGLETMRFFVEIGNLSIISWTFSSTLDTSSVCGLLAEVLSRTYNSI
jgi:hypothetical protein